MFGNKVLVALVIYNFMNTKVVVINTFPKRKVNFYNSIFSSLFLDLSFIFWSH